MADEPGPSGEGVKEKSPLPEEIDLYSDKFDPLAYLYSDKVKIPRPDAKRFDNIAKMDSYIQRGIQPVNRGKKPDKKDVPVRRWLPHQLPIQSQKPRRIPKNVFTRMEAIQGPLAVLRKYIEEKTRIKVVTRNEKGVRGYCIATLLVFDKHFNLVLKDVDEVWNRSIKIKKNSLLTDVSSNKIEVDLEKVTKNFVKIPKIASRKISKNTEECKRHVDQMLMRGEHVVLIYPIAPNKRYDDQEIIVID